jgi:folate-binding Fe-S cluster repair protein YgfZ
LSPWRRATHPGWTRTSPPTKRLRIIGTDPQEWLQGQQAADLLKADLAVLGGKVTIQVKAVEAFSEGSVGWGVALPEITLEDGK